VKEKAPLRGKLPRAKRPAKMRVGAQILSLPSSLVDDDSGSLLYSTCTPASALLRELNSRLRDAISPPCLLS
jgi:hypothetical protein